MGPVPGQRHGSVRRPEGQSPSPPVPAFDAVILAGGRSSRLGGSPKALLRIAGQSLLGRTVSTVARAGAGRIAVVGPSEYVEPGEGAGVGTEAADLLAVREDPPFSGPAAAIGAGLGALAGAGADAPWILVLACDMPDVEPAVQALLQAGAVESTAAETGALPALLAVEAGRTQPLVALHPTEVLQDAVRARQQSGGLANLSVFKLLARVHWKEVPVPAGSTSDVDTWEDARRAGAMEGAGLPLAGTPDPSHRSIDGKPGGTA